MGKDVIIRGETYNGVGKVNLLTANGSANFYDVSGALCTITAEYDEVEEYDEVYTSDKTAQEVYDALEVGINPVFRFHNLLDDDAYIYASMTKLESTADGEELTLSSFQTDAMIADTLSDYFTLTVHGEPPAVEKTVSGGLITITDALAEPAVALLTDIEPVQDLHGYDSPWPAGGGKNLFDIDNPFITAATAGYITSYAPKVEDGKFYNGGKMGETAGASYTIPVEDGSTYTVQFVIGGESANWEVRAVTLNGNVWTSNTTLSSNVSGPVTGYISTTVTVPSGKTHLFVACYSATKQGSWETDIQIEKGSPASAWTPYSNICPISGYDEANIVVSPTLDGQDGTTYTVSFGSAGTVYGGTLDVVNGTLTVTHGQIASYAGETLPGAWISDRDVYAAGTTPTTGAQVVYELATPQTVTLTPTEVTLLLGTNNVWSDTGDTTLTYKADGMVNSLTALNMLLGGMYEPSSDVTDKEALSIIMGETE